MLQVLFGREHLLKRAPKAFNILTCLFLKPIVFNNA